MKFHHWEIVETPLPSVLLTGATASGKSKLALKIAQENNGEIINVDSMQVYRQLHILTARPSLKDTKIVPPSSLRSCRGER